MDQKEWKEVSVCVCQSREKNTIYKERWGEEEWNWIKQKNGVASPGGCCKASSYAIPRQKNKTKSLVLLLLPHCKQASALSFPFPLSNTYNTTSRKSAYLPPCRRRCDGSPAGVQRRPFVLELGGGVGWGRNSNEMKEERETTQQLPL
jgi:hypothetical protein